MNEPLKPAVKKRNGTRSESGKPRQATTKQKRKCERLRGPEPPEPGSRTQPKGKKAMSQLADNDTGQRVTVNWWTGRKKRDLKVRPVNGFDHLGVTDPETQRLPGRRTIGIATGLLVLVGGAAFAVSFGAQRAYVQAEKGVPWQAFTEAGLFDLGMIILAMLGIGLSLARKPSVSVRVGILLCAFGSAAMNFAAANDGNWKSILAFVFPALFAAYITDRVIATVRRIYLADEETSAWDIAGKALVTGFRLSLTVALYSLRFLMDRKGTWAGVRQLVLNSAPLPAPVKVLAVPEKPLTKKARLYQLYKLDPAYGARSEVGKAAERLAPIVPCSAGGARRDLAALFDGDTLRAE